MTLRAVRKFDLTCDGYGTGGKPCEVVIKTEQYDTPAVEMQRATTPRRPDNGG